MPKFSYLKALCIGRTQDIDAFENALSQVMIKYPKDPVKEKAQEMLDLIRKQKNPGETIGDSTAVIKQKTKFVFKEDGEYYYVVVVENGKGDLNKFKNKLSDMNSEFYSTADLAVSTVFLDVTHQMVSVKAFDGMRKAMDYFNIADSNKEVFADLLKGTYQTFVISAENYAVFYKDKNITEYELFFTRNFK